MAAWTTTRHSRAQFTARERLIVASAAACPHDPADPAIRRAPAPRARADGCRPSTTTSQRLVDDMIETMYAAPGVGLAATQVGVPLRVFVVDLSVGRNPRDLIVMINPGLRRARRHAARRRRLPERARVQRDRRPARRAPSSRASIGTGTEQTVEGTGPAGARLSARDGSSRRHGVRRSAARHQAGPDRPQDPEAEARRANGRRPAPLRIVFFGTPAFAVPTLTALLTSRHTVVARRVAAGSAEGRGHRRRRDADQGARGRSAAFRCCSRRSSATRRFLRRLPALRAGPRRRRRLRADPARRAARDSAARDDQRARLAAAALAGRRAVHRAVIAGDSVTGVTIMRVVKELDAGPMLARVTVPIGPDDDQRRSRSALAERGAALLLDVVEQLAAGAAVETPQDDAQATYAAKIAEDRRSDRLVASGACASTTWSAACSPGRSPRPPSNGSRCPDPQDCCRGSIE